MHAPGFNFTIPNHWNNWWLAMWVVVSPALIVSAFFVDVLVWVPAAILGFLLPEMISIIRKDDSLPPLTHTIRHFLKNFIAFPLIYFSLGSVGAHWLGFAHPLRLGALMGLLGWLTDHFSMSYAAPDPFPYTSRKLEPGDDTPRLPL